ncbi:MAG: diguanylate cyclase [Thermoanaerobaculia bacterium]
MSDSGPRSSPVPPDSGGERLPAIAFVVSEAPDRDHGTWTTVSAALLFLLASTPALGLHPATRHYGQRDGLPQSRVSAVSQDARGLLWIGTKRGGLARYDGRTWRVLDTADGLPSSDVRWISRDPGGNLFVATAGGYGRVRDGRFEPIGPSAAATDRLVRVLEASTPGTLWIGRRAGLLVWSEKGGEVVVPLEREGRPPDVQWLAPDGTGGIYAATDVGLAHVGPPPGLAVSWVAGLPPDDTTVVSRLQDGRLAVAVTGAGLFVGKPGDFHRIGDDRRPGLKVISLLDGGEEGLFVGTSGAGAFLCRERCEPLTGNDLAPDGIVFEIFRDREGVLWFATDGGLGKRVASAFRTLDESDGFPRTEWLYGMTETADGAVWIAASDHRVVRLDADGRASVFTGADGLPGVLVTDVLSPRSGEGPLVCTRRGLFRRRGGRFVHERLPGGVPDDVDSALDTADGLYVATWNRGLYLVRDGAALRVPPPVGPVVEALAPLPDGRIWCGGDGFGIALVAAGRVVSRLTTRDGLPSDQVHGILVDSKGDLWVATEAGAWCRRRDGSSFLLDRDAGLPGSYVYWVVEDHEGAHWLGTNHGVVRRAADGRLELFTTRDGLERNECSPDSAFVDSRGRLFVGTSTLSVFDRRPAPPGARPLVHLEADAGAGWLPEGSTLRLRAGSGPVRFRFASPSFVDEDSTTFRTRLTGVADAWQTTGTGQDTSTWGRLSPGAYRFEVQAVTGDGRVSESPAGIAVVVEPRWWERGDVRLAAIALAVLVGALALIVRDRRHARAAARLKALVDERTDALRSANARLESLAATDELTGVANRRSATERLAQAIAVARRNGSPLAIALVDLDGFKGVNDSFGHSAGDDCLHWIAGVLAGALRAGDFLGRFGGDEFLAVLVDTDLEGARVVAARMSAELAARPWRPEGSTGPSRPLVTLSIGLAALAPADPDAAAFLLRADRALYAAKNAGRARAVAAE